MAIGGRFKALRGVMGVTDHLNDPWKLRVAKTLIQKALQVYPTITDDLSVRSQLVALKMPAKNARLSSCVSYLQLAGDIQPQQLCILRFLPWLLPRCRE